MPDSQKRNRPVITERDLLAALEQAELSFPPLRLAPEATHGKRTAPDAIVRASWGRKRYRFAVECNAGGTPRLIAAAVAQACMTARALGLHPLILVPYLAVEQLDKLVAQQVSGLDLCGNGVLIVPGELMVYRTGTPNRFPRVGTIKNVYRRTSSIVARVFLATPQFPSINDAWAAIGQRGGRVTLATVSKVCTALDADLVLERQREPGTRNRRLRLVQPDKLLDLLAENYIPPEVRATFTGKYLRPLDELAPALEAWKDGAGKRLVRTGAASVDAYAVMAHDMMQTFYCTDLPDLLGRLGRDVQPGERFANLRLLETHDEFPYFDARPSLLASPVQAYLELTTGDKRDQETAEQVRQLILAELRMAQPREVRDGPTAGEPA